MYDRSTSADTIVNDARLNLFARKQRPYDAIPPTQTALKLHSKRAAYPRPTTKSPADWGWSSQGDTWKIHWTDISSVAASCQELTRGGYMKDCCGRSKCLRSGLNCTVLCSCSCEKLFHLVIDYSAYTMYIAQQHCLTLLRHQKLVKKTAFELTSQKLLRIMNCRP